MLVRTTRLRVGPKRWKSRGEAKRLMKEGALAIDGQRCEDALSPLPAGEYVVKLGKKRFLKLIVS